MPIDDRNLPRCEANHVPLTPLSFLDRTAELYPDRLAIVHGLGETALRQTWNETRIRCRRLASALRQAGIDRQDTVAALLPNTPPMVEAHFGVPMAGAVLNTLNTRLDPEAIAFMLDHGEARAVLVDPEFAALLARALPLRQRSDPLLVIQTQDAGFGAPTAVLEAVDYEAFLAGGDPDFAGVMPLDEWDAIALNYTSGTTGNPKGVLYHHRGAALNALSNILEWDMPKHPVYLWTLPLFHCNGWCFPWTLAARAGVNVCLRRVEAATVFDLMRAHRVTHYCGAPIVHAMLANAPEALKAGLQRGIRGMVAASAPPAALLEAMERMGIELTHVYGLTEVYGPATVCAPQAGWAELPVEERARLNARQGVRYHLQHEARVLDPDTLQPVPWDGETMGEIMFRGNIVMKGYLKNPQATAQAFAGGWFHTGDLAVQYPDGYIKIKDRSKDIIISGGENISSIEVEDVLYRHPAVQAAAVVAKPDPRWGETPCAFVELKDGADVTAEAIIAHCRAHLAGFKVPRAVVFGELPKTSTGKIQKFELRKRAGSVQAIDV
ncbi:acyl-CoA synthetase [Tepidimonas fonticaldi]|uniref:Acyl-CoA synthetase n=1 Tax=Tepidimonas fonticaldi TaxID=1101373 RepID=A0A1A6DYW3_9BURK|nr:acyl-CoA synthetase [Tepidimonas fonticaldi]OBS31965.1 acyl-CoA synthetase [Tepidimonas fonticaldi]